MKYFFLFLLFILFLILEASFFNLPLVLIALIVTTVVFKDYYSFFLAFFFGLMLDIVTFQTIGKSSIFFTILVFLIFSYQKKFEITTNYFVIFACFLASILFSFTFGLSNIISQSIVSVILGVITFQFLKRINIEKQISNS